ncbi:MAG: FAD-dependent oxidoreductase [bacterium]|nr:FAD-dependent oxidoreductase [bacterium]
MPEQPTLSPEAPPFDVVIIGAGLAGLTAALHLAERGLQPLVLEADQQWAGGRLSGGEPERIVHHGCVWAFPSEHGIHALWGGYVNMRATLERFLDLTPIPSSGEVWINRWGYTITRIEAGSAVRYSWLPAPFHHVQLLLRPRFWTTITPLDFLSLPGFLVSILLTVGLDPLVERRALDGLSMDDYFGGWTPNLKATFIGLGKNLLAAPRERISLTAFIAAIRFYTLLRRDSWFPHFFPDDSDTALIAPMIARLQALGGRVQYGATADRLEKTAAGWRVIVDDAPRRGKRSLETQHVILAVNAPAAARLLCAGEATASQAAKLRFPGSLKTTTVRLWFSAAPTHGGTSGMLTGDFTFDNFFWLHEMQPAFQTWHQATGGSAVELHLYAGDKLNDQPDAALIRQAEDEITLAFPQVRGTLLHSTIRRNSKTHTEFRVPTADSLHVETPYPNIFACGDWIGFDTPSLWMERACTTGIAAANAVLAACGKPGYAIRQPSPPEALARTLHGVVGLGRGAIRVPLQWMRRGRTRRMKMRR